MSRSNKDDWIKPRSHGHKLTEAEKEIIRTARLIGRDTRDVARELQCSTRCVAKYYRVFSGKPKPVRHQSRPKPIKRPKAIPPRSDRFYHSNFEPM